MRLRLLKVILGAALFLLVFVGAALVTNYINNRGRDSVSVEMPGETLPAVFSELSDEKINYMPAYKTVLNTSLYRDSIYPLSEDKKIVILVLNRGKSNGAINYELRDESGETLIEKGEMNYVGDRDNYNRYEASIRMNLKEGEEYSFIVKTKYEKQDLYFYTRVIRLKKNELSFLMDYAEEFSKATFTADKKTLSTELEQKADESGGSIAENSDEGEGDGSASIKAATATDAGKVSAEDIEAVLKNTNQTEDRNYLGVVSLGSTLEAVTWGGLKPEKVGETIKTVKEVSENSAVISFSYVVTAFNSDQSQNIYYSVEEIYELSFAPDTGKANISDYHRYMNRAFSGSQLVQENNSINLGAVDSYNPEYIATEDCEKIGFVADECLWYFDYNEGWITKVFGEETSAASPASRGMKRYDIICLKMDEDYIDFAVYGRIPSGQNEGHEGVEVYKYSIKDHNLCSILFLETNLSYTVLKNSVGRLATYNENTGIFYTIIGQDLVSYNTFSDEVEHITTGLKESDIKSSKDRTVAAFPNSSDETKVTEISLIDLLNGATDKITAEGKILTPLGFIGNDFVYGVSTTENVTVGADGIASFLFDSINIIKRDGSLAKKYEKPGVLISDLTFLNNTIYLSRVEKNDGNISKLEADYISYKTEDNSRIITSELNKTSQTLNELNLKFPDFIYMYSDPTERVTKYDRKKSTKTTVTGDISRDIVYVFQGRGIEMESKSIGRAVRKVNNNGGYVVDSDGDIIYRHKKGALYLTVAGKFDYKTAASDAESFTACLYMGLAASGNKVEMSELLDVTDWEKAFDEFGGSARGLNLTGADLDTAILYLSEGIPFATKIDGRYVMVVSFNNEAIRYYDPVQGTEVRVNRNSFKEDVEEAGDEFYLYMK